MLRKIPTTDAVVDGFVWHYTSVPGLKGIIDSGGLWATRSSFLNDETELKYGIKLFKSRLVQKISHMAKSGERSYLESVLTAFDHYSEALDFDGESIYLLSASKNGDSLNQWAHYSGQSGAAIGLRADHQLLIAGENEDAVPYSKKLPESGELVNPCYSLAGWRSVIYDENLQLKKVDELIDFLLESKATMKAVEQNARDNGVAARLEIIRTVWMPVRLVCTFLKHPSFKDEREVRQVFLDATGELTRFRSTESAIVPFLMTRFTSESSSTVEPTSHLAHVRLGPGARQNRLRPIQEFLEKSGHQEIEVSMSNCPYTPSR